MGACTGDVACYDRRVSACGVCGLPQIRTEFEGGPRTEPMDEPGRVGLGVMADADSPDGRGRRLFVRYAPGFGNVFRWSDGINGYVWEDLSNPAPLVESPTCEHRWLLRTETPFTATRICQVCGYEDPAPLPRSRPRSPCADA